MTEIIRYIGSGPDDPDRDVPEGLTKKDLVELFRWLVLLRTFDERSVALQRQGRIGTYALYWGEEGTQAGPLFALDESDWVFPSYRQNSIGILRGVPPAVILAWWRGYGGELARAPGQQRGPDLGLVHLQAAEEHQVGGSGQGEEQPGDDRDHQRKSHHDGLNRDLVEARQTCRRLGIVGVGLPLRLAEDVAGHLCARAPARLDEILELQGSLDLGDSFTDVPGGTAS